MNKTKYILLCTAALLASCQERLEPTYSVGADDNAIVLAAGISEGGSGVVTRAVANPDANHSSHVSLKENTIMRLRVDGDWWKTAEGPATEIKQITNAKAGNIVTNTNDKHRQLKDYSPQLYWDDYGTADPNNTSTTSPGKGREKGLTIYGVAVDGESALPSTLSSLSTTVSTWQSLSWNVGTPSTGANPAINQQSGWANYDLLTSNNVVYSSTPAEDNAYKFEDRVSGKLLEFTHAMTKVTVELTAGAGFADAKFVNKPEVTLLGFNYTGTVSVEAKTSTATADTKTDIKAHLAEVVTASGGTWSDAPATWAASHKTKYDALVFPGNSFIANIATEEPHKPTSSTDILKIDADGNIYTVTAAQLVKAIANGATGEQTGTLEQAKNYILKVTINKTSIDVTATIKDWVDVESEQETPIIGFSQCYGQTTGGGLSDFAKGFTFYRSTAVGGSYLEDGNKADVTYNASTYTMSPQLYWPDHSTHYFFRGIWPEVKSESGKTPTEKVESNGIEVENCNYTADTYPTDLMIGMPRKTDGTADETCKVDAHKTGEPATAPSGICATDAVSAAHPNEGLIHMNFQYAMSQVIVKLTTNEASGAKDNVTFNEHTKVEIVDCYTGGKILLSDGASDFTGKTVTDFTMSKDNNITGALANQYANYRNVVIPQNLTNGTGAEAKDLKFRITVGDGTLNDVYETVLGIKNIQVQEGSGDLKSITAWEPGKRYTYTLYITKTDIKVTATLKDWIEVKASEDVWF